MPSGPRCPGCGKLPHGGACADPIVQTSMSELRRVRREASNAALEDAAKVVEAHHSISWCEENYAREIATAIRALKKG